MSTVTTDALLILHRTLDMFSYMYCILLLVVLKKVTPCHNSVILQHFIVTVKYSCVLVDIRISGY